MVIALIVNYRSSEVLARCLESLRSEAVARVAVLENGSPGDEWDRLKAVAATHPNVDVYRSAENLGFGGGMNHLYALVEPEPQELLWLLNPDTVVGTGSAAALAETVARHGGAVVTPRIVTGAPHSSVWFNQGRLVRTAGRTIEKRSVRHQATGVMSCDYVSGAAMMLPAALFEQLRGFDARLFLYWEDVDLSIRARAQGRAVLIDHDVSVWHQEGGSSKPSPSARELVYFYVSRNRILVCRRPGTRGLDLVVGRGLIALARLAAHALLRGGRGGWSRLRAVGRGTRAALAMPDFTPGGSMESRHD